MPPSASPHRRTAPPRWCTWPSPSTRINRVIYLDSDLVVVDDIGNLWWTGLGSRASGGAGNTRRIERWMEVQKIGAGRIYELGSLPPFLLVLAGHVTPIKRRWNQHSLGGDNVRGSCRDLHPGHVSRLHWSGSGKPWVQLDSKRSCPHDHLWDPYDLYGRANA
ncbi:unnamed protein product [Musa hybrid cultivar]